MPDWVCKPARRFYWIIGCAFVLVFRMIGMRCSENNIAILRKLPINRIMKLEKATTYWKI